MSKVAFTELACRVEATPGPDRDIDWRIFELVRSDREHCAYIEGKPYPAYTASIDAAMTLIEPDWFFHLSRFSPDADGGGQAHIYPNRGFGDDYDADAATPALALVAAALRARA